MAQKKNKRHRKVAFVFLEPLTKVPPASAGSGARKRGGPESAMIKNKRHRKVAFVFLEPLTKVPPASAGSGARKRGGPESVMKKQAPPRGGIF